jgi:hypothetical protein
LENIQILENQFQEEKSIGIIDMLQLLYSKAIEYLSAIGDNNFELFIDKMRDLLSREDVQVILQIGQD